MALLTRVSGNGLRFSNNCFYKLSLDWLKAKLNKKSPCNFTRCKHGTTNGKVVNKGLSSRDDKKKKYLVFEDAISQRRNQAQRSVIIQVQSDQSSYELYNYCSQFGNIQEMHHYKVNGNHFVLIEFKTISDMNSISSISTHNNLQQNLPVISPMLWFRAVTNGSQKGSFSKDIPMTVINGKDFPNTQTINDWLFQAESISDQMMILCNSTKLNDTDIRLRFLTARQIENCLSGMFDTLSVLPFGSSVNGFGKHGCDLDLVLKLQTDPKEISKGRLIYHTKAGGFTERVQAQRAMETISEVMKTFLPGIASIRRILKARVPIIKYNQTLTDLECDLSMTNTIGIYMSELLYLYGELDWRVRPLTFTIRMWANCVQLTNNSPGCWITNFSLTLLVLFYLQQKQMLPSLQQLVKLANKNDIRIADGCVDCTFLRDISRLPKSPTRNEDSLEELLTEFFVYYSNFDFATKAVSLNTGTPIPKPDTSSLFICNPFEQGLNVSKNISIQEMERLRIEMRNAGWLLDSAAENKSIDWGLLTLFQQKVHHTGSASFNNKGRMLELSTLFKEPSIAGNVVLKDSNDTLGISVSTGVKDVERQAVRNLKTKSSRKQERRR